MQTQMPFYAEKDCCKNMDKTEDADKGKGTEENKITEHQPPVYLDNNGKTIPFIEKKQQGKQKKTFRIGFVSVLGLFTGFLALFMFTPLPTLLIKLTPTSIKSKILSPLYRETTLSNDLTHFKKPMKLTIPPPGTLPVLGFDTGICFSFYATMAAPNATYIDSKTLAATKRNQPLAEIIAIGKENGYEYHLKSTSYRESIDKKNHVFSIVCQKFGRAYASTPNAIKALYIRPLTPFTAHKTLWNTTKHFHDDHASP